MKTTTIFDLPREVCRSVIVQVAYRAFEKTEYDPQLTFELWIAQIIPGYAIPKLRWHFGDELDSSIDQFVSEVMGERR